MANKQKIRSGKTPTGVSLQELVAGFKNQNIAIPDTVKKILEEQSPKKVEIKTAQEAYARANAAYNQANTANTIATEALVQTSNVTANTTTKPFIETAKPKAIPKNV